MQFKPHKIAVLMGGIGQEREVSLGSGRCVAEALSEAGHEIVSWDVAPDRLEILDDSSVDLFFMALHGEFGEDGQLQEILEQRGLVYTGSRSGPCRVAFDKQASKAVFEAKGVLTPRGVVFDPAWPKSRFDAMVEPLGPRVVIKPICQGSSVGVQILDVDASLHAACCATVEAHGTCLIEAFVAGRETTVGILNGQVLPVIEIRTPGSDFYDYQAKYLGQATEYLFETVSPACAVAMQKAALSCFHGIGLRHVARVDCMVTAGGEAFVLEVNAIPGLTSHSLLPKAAARKGLDMSALCCQVVEAALSGELN
ncbi:MAG: D-alanine--D-alanine ligase [Planctomycetes bacterium]|nr:D-alanine--D-alanine ligase [Planctomycetota bacterium]